MANDRWTVSELEHAISNSPGVQSPTYRHYHLFQYLEWCHCPVWTKYDVRSSPVADPGFPVGGGVDLVGGGFGLPRAVTFRKFCMSKWKKLGPLGGAARRAAPHPRSANAVNSIASSIQANLPSHRCSSRNSYSPAMSDSGISVDAGSKRSNNSGVINLAALAKLGTISVNVWVWKYQ